MPTTRSIFGPGIERRKEHRVLTPLLDAKLHKAEIRYLSERAGLPSWDRPASACLASRLPYGTEVTPERLSLVERGEAALRGLGSGNSGCGCTTNWPGIELAPDELPRALSAEMAAAMAKAP